MHEAQSVYFAMFQGPKKSAPKPTLWKKHDCCPTCDLLSSAHHVLFAGLCAAFRRRFAGISQAFRGRFAGISWAFRRRFAGASRALRGRFAHAQPTSTPFYPGRKKPKRRHLVWEIEAIAVGNGRADAAGDLEVAPSLKNRIF